MTKIARFNGDLPAFAGEAPGNERTVFDEVTQSDALTDQFTQGFLRGWGIISPTEFPTREDLNAAFFTATKLISYLHQMGVPEWNIQQRYYEGSLTTTGGLVYKSRVGTSETPNVGNEPSVSGAEWALILDATQYATQAQAQSGTSLTALMSPQRTTDHFNDRTSPLTRAILGRTTEAQIRSDLSVLQAGTADAQVRTNVQNDGRFAQLDGGNWGAEGLGGLGYGGRSSDSDDWDSLTTTRFMGGLTNSPTSTNSWGFTIITSGGDRGYSLAARDDSYWKGLNDTGWRRYWDDNNLPDPARLSGAQTFTGNKEFTSPNFDPSIIVNRSDDGACSALWERGTREGAISMGIDEFVFIYRDSSGNILSRLDLTGSGSVRVRGPLQVDGTISGGARNFNEFGIGQIIFAGRTGTSTRQMLHQTAGNRTIAGSSLRLAGVANYATSPSITDIPGTWACKGHSGGAQLSNESTTVWERVAV